MMTARAPLTDFFGTRLEPDALAAGLRAQGLARFALVLTDAGPVLRLPRSALGGDAAQRAETWLRGEFSPLLPVRVEAVRSVRGLAGRVADRRRRRVAVVALAEVFDEREKPSAEAALRARVGGRVHAMSWRRPGGRSGVRPALLLAASRDARSLAWLKAALADERGFPAPPSEILLDGLEWGVARRPTVAADAPAGAPPVLADDARCGGCGTCAAVCPAACLDGRGRFLAGAAERCLSCFDCVEACPQDALRPARSASSATTSRSLARRPGWLARLRGAAGPPLPAPFPPSFLLPRADAATPRLILGLAVATRQEHAAALVDGGAVAGAAEEERFSRVRHQGWESPARPGSTLASDPTLCLEEVLCRRALGALLAPRGLTLDDMDLLAVNGLPARYRRAFSATDAASAPPALRAGRVLFLPHHLCHAASAWRASGLRDGHVLSVDGRGDRETAAVFEASVGRLREVLELLSLGERSVGGVYETATRLLGFGAHGQGSVMALAALGTPRVGLSRWLSYRSRGDFAVRERAFAERFAALARRPGGPLARERRDLAASLQAALEALLLAVLKDAGVPAGADALCLAGGVALNCRANAAIRRALRPKAMFVPPGANDAGTALGAALEAAAMLGLPPPAPLADAALGPGFTDAEAEAALAHAGLPYHRSDALASETAELLAGGAVVAWCQGPMEFGPRALGRRSLLADPRRADMAARMNRLKDREPWRPFGPSILAGREAEWFAEAFDSPFMLFAVPVRPERAAEIPAVVHADGSARPQSVHPETNPLYHALLTEFAARSGVPMLLNTSFNRCGEPIVATPRDAVACFLGLPDADALVLGPFVARRPAAVRAPRAGGDAALASLPGARRLLLRLTARCDSACAHCALGDLAHLPDRSFDDALRALRAGRRAGCAELVVLRGEAARRPDLPELLRRARAMGYRFVQLQTGGRPLAREPVRRALLPLLDALEVAVYSADPRVHDALTGRPGSLRETLAAAKAAAAAGREVALTVPVLRRALPGLARVPALAKALGARRVVFAFPRPLETAAGVQSAELARLSDAAPAVGAALDAAARAGVAASTEGVPFCLLAPEHRQGPDAAEDWSRFRVDDLDRLDDSLAPGRSGQRPESPKCRGCRLRASCPRTWAAYLALFGSGELAPPPPGR